jgi:hypothetical protein
MNWRVEFRPEVALYKKIRDPVVEHNRTSSKPAQAGW